MSGLRYINGRKWVCDTPGDCWRTYDGVWELTKERHGWWLTGLAEPWTSIRRDMECVALAKAFWNAEMIIAELQWESDVARAKQEEQDAVVERIIKEGSS